MNDRTTTELVFDRVGSSTLVNRLSLAMKISSLGVWEWDLADESLTWDERMFEIYGIGSTSRVSREDWLNLVHHGDRKTAEDFFRIAIETCSENFVKYRIVRPDGELRRVASAATVVLDDAGDVVRVTGVVKDVTDERQTQIDEDLQQDRNLFVTGPVVVFKWKNSAGWPVEYVSPNVEEVFGYSVRDLINGTVSYAGLVPPDDLSRVADEVVVNVQSGAENFAHQPYRIVRRDGKLIWIDDFTTIIRNEDGEVTHYLGYIVDITKRKQAEDALLSSRTRYQALFDDSPAPLWDEDFNETLAYVEELERRGVGDLRTYFDRNPNELKTCAQKVKIKDVNQEVLKLHKANSKRELLGNMDKIFTKKSYAVFKEQLLAIVSGQLEFESEAEVRTLDGELRHVFLRLIIVKDHEKSTRAFIATTDISDRKRWEDRLLAYQQRLKSLASELTITEERTRRRIAVDLHDHVGQTLALARIQLAGALKAARDPDLATRLNELSALMLQATRDTRHVIHDLSSPSLSELGLAPAISEWLEEQVGERHGIETEFVLDGQAITMDDDLNAILFRSVRELLTNVIKHAAANRVRVSIDFLDGMVRIVVDDDGVGFNSHSESHRVGAQGGFGLFSIKERMTNLGGALEIVTQPGNGCRAILSVFLSGP